ncbi:alpha/beta hydrolase-fold protein [Plantactinospora siamensis]|uniref:Alpha/beta hydrolase-fold protein n=1 Tax=Plantactinospora siamensis TaxID=555372 RepID=A0ABV6NSU5_9ACTN
MTETSPAIERLRADLAAGIPDAAPGFWRQVAAAGTPLVEEVEDGSALVTFLWRGEAAETSVCWGVEAELRRIEGTDIWYASRRLPTNLRTLYYLAHGPAYRWRFPPDASGAGPSHVDPLNRSPFLFPPDPADPTDRPCWASQVELPVAPAERWSLPRPGVPRGTLLRTSIRTAALSGRRRLAVYRPPGPRRRPLPLLVVFDGHLSRTVLRIPTTLDNLIAAGEIPPTMAVFVANPSGGRRSRELRPAPATRAFVTRELLPMLRRRWPVTDDPGQRIIAGSSLGGLAAAYVALEAPSEFGAVIAQSGSFWWPIKTETTEPEWLTREYARRPRAPVRFCLDVGDREDIEPGNGQLDQLSVNRRFRDMLVERGYEVSYSEYSGAHDYINWRRTFGDHLRTLLAWPA